MGQIKLKTKIEHQFDIDPAVIMDWDFSVDMMSTTKTIKMKTKIIEVKRQKNRKDAPTRLF